MVDKPLSKGLSGGPALVVQDGQMTIAGIVIRGRSTRGRSAEQTLLRTIDQVVELNWTSRFDRAVGRNVQIVEQTTNDGEVLQLSIDLSIFDLVGETFRLLFYATESQMGQPQQPPKARGPLAIWTDLTPRHFMDSHTVHLTVPVAELGMTPDRLTFYGMLWDRTHGESIWASDVVRQVDEDAIVIGSETELDDREPSEPQQTATPTITSTATQRLAAIRTPTSRPTRTPTLTRTSGPISLKTPTPTFTIKIALPTTTRSVGVDAQRSSSSMLGAQLAISAESRQFICGSAACKSRDEAMQQAIDNIGGSGPLAGEVREFGGIRFVYVPAGPFTMGSTEQQLEDALELCNSYYGDGDDCKRTWFADEQPQSTIETDAFWIMETEVTNEHYRAFVEAGGYGEERYWTDVGWAWREGNSITQPGDWDDWNGADYPVVWVSWHEAVAFARWLTEETGEAIRLPTEAEWEKAARGPKGRIFPWGDEWMSSNLNFCDTNCQFDWKDESADDGFATTAPVGSYPTGKSPYNALDMVGNVWEWTSTIYDRNQFPYPYKMDEREALEGDALRVLRGGSWRDSRFSTRVSFPCCDIPVIRDGDVGMRLVISPGS
ncbi:formylglycine-generating enzyme family protein [Chloroflexi bacterium TSY]|nr:formylglycine-generating enzyme family protein [Chloroflexi bacterium TSY]